MREVMAQVERVAASETRVCIRGETGTGKELVARTLHEKSPRHGGPFVSLNCAAIPAELMESELFGHEKGSFTARRRGTSGNSSRRTAARCFSTRSAICRWQCRRSCCACWRRARSSAWAATAIRRGRARGGGDASQSRGAGAAGNVSARICITACYVFPIVLPPLRERREDIRVLARAFCAAGGRAEWMEAEDAFAGRDRGAGTLRVAGKCARVAECGRAGAAAGAGR